MENNFESISNNFDIPDEVMDEIQKNIENIIESFPIPDVNKIDVIKKINFMCSRSKYLSSTDALTGLSNRREFDNVAEKEFLRSKRYNRSMTIAVLDIDFFKNINDTYGHLCGDYVLKEIAYILISNFRKTDYVFRYGGEEFVIILPETDIKNSYIPLERLRKTIEKYEFCFHKKPFNITASIGYAENNVSTLNELIENADKSLYDAKFQGRNIIKAYIKN